MENTQKILGKNLRDLIEFRGLKNKTELAKLLGINHKTIYDIYSDIGNPKLETLDSIANILKVPTWFLLQNITSIKDVEYLGAKNMDILAKLFLNIEKANK
jgi:transcriptional regulator with XRE-family HTH domain